MNLLRRVASLPPAERLLLLRAACTVTFFRLGLSTVPFSRLLRLAERGLRGSRSAVEPDRAAWAVRVVSRRVPHATCLTQALALQALLAEGGRRGHLRIGVRNEKPGRIAAHAWLELDGRVLIGERERSSYLTLPFPK